MKRVIVLILCFAILITGCQTNKKDPKTTHTPTQAGEDNLTQGSEADPSQTVENENTQDNKTNEDVIGEGGNSASDGVITLLKLNTTWSLVKSVELLQPKYQEEATKAEVKPYSIAKDLSNIENMNQFPGFTEEQVNMLASNGFVVLPSRDTKIYHVYDSNEYRGVPNFITSDTVLHLYHQFYDKSLMGIESGFLYHDLELMTKQMLDKSIILYHQLEDEELKDLQKKNIVYFLVARMLMLQSPETTVEVDQELLAVAKQEYELIEKAENFTKSPLFEIDLDYSQFTIRGHYTRSEELGRFFRTMMWFGTAPLELADDQGNMVYDNVLKSLLITYTTFSDSEGVCDAELWSNIYQPTAQYVGLSDDINVFTMNGLRMSVYGDNSKPEVFNDEEYQEALTEAVNALPKPQIQGKLTTVSSPTGLQFRYMGQRYILDSFVMQELMEPYLRPIPSSLDVMGAMGNQLAEELLFNVYRPQDEWSDYTQIYQILKKEVSGYTNEVWQKNLYNGWLWSLQEVFTEYGKDSGMPFFMTTKAWRYKSLNTALGSYTELKHDTVLYGKQGVAEMGDEDAYATADQHYVEPNLPLYRKLHYLTDYTITILKDLDMLDDNMSEAAENYKDLLRILIRCSEKELGNEALTEEEKLYLKWYGGKIEGIISDFNYGATHDYEVYDISDMLVTDIATNPGAYLSLGTGYFDEIYVVVPVENKLYLSRGSVYSFYEFVSGKRLTDEEWWELNGISVVKETYGSYPSLNEPSENLPKQPDWTRAFKTDVNNVEIIRLEVIRRKVSK